MKKNTLTRKINIWLRFFGVKLWRILRYLVSQGITSKQIKKLHRELSIDATWNTNYIMCTISACMIATFGLISNSTAVIIGAMLIAPLMLPLRALAFSALEGDVRLFIKAVLSITGATILALFLSCLTGNLVAIPEFGSELLARTQPNLVDLGIAITAGSISAFAKLRKGISDALAGTAIAVALMPPLCVVGLSLSQGMFTYSKGAFILYLTNLLGITLACMIIFILAGYAEANHALGWALAMTALLIFPLGLSFIRLVRQIQLQETLKETLVNKTVTLGQREIHLININMDWNMIPPLAILNVQTQEEISPKQVRLVQEFISRQMRQPFHLKFIVEKIEVIDPEFSQENYTQPRWQAPRD